MATVNTIIYKTEVDYDFSFVDNSIETCAVYKHELSLCVCISEDDIECSDWFLVMHLSNSSSSEP